MQTGRTAPAFSGQRHASGLVEETMKARFGSSSPSRFGRGLLVGLVVGMALLMGAVLVPSVIGFKPMVVMSGSMEPALSTGDIAVVRPVDVTKLKLGDVITYEEGGRLITHRIMAVTIGPDGSSYVLQGDANTAADRVPVEPDAIVGKVIYRIPRVGSIISFANSGMGRLSLFALPLLALAWMGFRQLKRRTHLALRQTTAATHDKRMLEASAGSGQGPKDNNAIASSPLSPVVNSYLDGVVQDTAVLPRDSSSRLSRVIPRDRVRRRA